MVAKAQGPGLWDQCSGPRARDYWTGTNGQGPWGNQWTGPRARDHWTRALGPVDPRAHGGTSGWDQWTTRPKAWDQTIEHALPPRNLQTDHKYSCYNLSRLTAQADHEWREMMDKAVAQ